MVSRARRASVEAAGLGDVFGALADDHRRRILGLLGDREMSVKAIALNFDVTRPAVVKHLAVLERACLVRTQRRGRERLYRLEARRLRVVRDWLAPYERFWASRLSRLKADVERG